MKIAISLGHWGKKDRDRGAVWRGIKEAHLAARYMVELAIALEERGHQVWMLTYGSLYDRQRYANKLGADLYLECHLNYADKPGNYGLILYDARNPKNKGRAEKMAKMLTKKYGYTWKIKGIKSRKDRGSKCIWYTKMPAFILEPAFINNAETMIKFFEDCHRKLAAVIDEVFG